MKKQEEIKKGLELCVLSYTKCVSKCPYAGDDCIERLVTDALALNQQLESKLNQAAEDIRMLGRMGQNVCPVCAHYNHGEGTKGECVKCLTGDGFEWRGFRE